MQKLWRFLILFPLICWGELPSANWQAKSEEEALFLRRIADFWQEGEYQIAKSQMEEFLTAYPDTVFADVLCATLGDIFLREKNYSTALNYYANVTDPELSSNIFLNRMQCLYCMEWYATLADECEQILKNSDLENSQKLQITYYLAIALYQQCLNASKDPDMLLKLAQRAQPYFETLFQSELNHEIAAAFAHLSCILKDYPKASSIYFDLAKKNPEEEEEMLFQAGLIQAEYDKETAAETFKEITLKDKKKAKEAAYNRLVLLFDAGHYDQLIEKQELFLRQIPEDRIAMAHLFFGRSYLALKKFPEANTELLAYIDDITQPDDTLRAALISLLDSSFKGDDLLSLESALAKMSAFFPGDAELSKGRFSRAMMLKKRQHIDESREELENLLVEFPQFPERAQVTFELAHLDFQSHSWISCKNRSLSFLSQFPDHPLSPYAWRYLISSSSEISLKDPQEKTLKEQLVTDLEMLLRQKKILSSQERCEWEFLLAKTVFELGRYENAISILQSLIDSTISFSQKPNAYLLLALCYRDGFDDLPRFCSLAEEAIEKKADLMDRGSLHALLFNAYLRNLEQNEQHIEKASEHLYAAFLAKHDLQTINLLWLTDLYFNRFLREESEGVSSRELMERIAFLLEHVLTPPLPQEEPFPLESSICKLAKIYSRLGRTQEGIDLLEKLMAQFSSAPSWKYEKEASLLLAECYASIGKKEDALVLFDSIAQEKSMLRTEIGASACLQSTRLRLNQQGYSSDDPYFLQVLAQLKDLVLQKTLVNEPLHLEAALDYIDLQTRSDFHKRIDLLVKVKEDFESTKDLLSKDYHEARTQFPGKNRIYQAYMQFFEAEILASKETLSEAVDERKELHAKAKDLLLQIINEKAHPFLVARALKRLENDVPISEHKT